MESVIAGIIVLILLGLAAYHIKRKRKERGDYTPTTKKDEGKYGPRNL